MLTTQFYDAAGNRGFYNAGFGYSGLGYQGGFGAIQSTAGTAALQTYMKTIGKLAADKVTGVMNDATMAQIFNMLVESAGTVGKIPTLPTDIRNGINTVVNALKSADSKIRSISFNQAGLSTVISQLTNIQAAVRLIGNGISSGAGDSAANAILAARDAVYNAVAGQASIIQKALAIFFPVPGAAPPATSPKDAILAQLRPGMIFTAQTLSPQPSPTAPAAPVAVAGMIYAFSPKLGKYRIAVPRIPGQPGGLGVMEDGAFGSCIFGDCGLGATAAPFVEQAPSDAAPGVPARQVTETELAKQTGTLPLYKQPLFWAAVAGGVVVVGGGGYWLMRRRKAAAPAATPAARSAY